MKSDLFFYALIRLSTTFDYNSTLENANYNCLCNYSGVKAPNCEKEKYWCYVNLNLNKDSIQTEIEAIINVLRNKPELKQYLHKNENSV